MSDQARSSPYNINTTSSRQVMRIKGNINLVIISCSNTKLSEFTLWKFYNGQYKGDFWRDLGSGRVEGGIGN